MRPYVSYFVAALQKRGVDQAISAIQALPLEQRYVWRICSALNWAFADFDSESVRLDWKTMGEPDKQRVAEMMRWRAYQLHSAAPSGCHFASSSTLRP